MVDEFDGTEINPDNWVYDVGTGSNGWGNNELQYYTNRNAYLKDGNLVIRAQKKNLAAEAILSATKNSGQAKLSVRAN